jgi:hypothetical protein
MDDGCVVYVNNVEIGRVNMPAGAITYSTLAASLYTGTTAGLAAVYNQMTIPAVRVPLPPSSLLSCFPAHCIPLPE